MNIILASQSPRRKELLERMGLTEFEICPARGEERVEPGLTPAQLVEQLLMGLDLRDAQSELVLQGAKKNAVKQAALRLKKLFEE